jgi:LmbE family N-acetylglucosaminyl deacetylase
MKKQNKKKETIITFAAHNDDQIIGAGGTLAKYSREGKDIFTVIFSYGESSHPHFKRKVTVEMRVKESLKADKVLGGSGIVYLGLKEGKFNKEIEKKGIKSKIKRIIREKKPTKIFIHSIDDPHPDHRAVYNLITNTVEEIKFNCDIYSFNIWNPISIRKRDAPKLVVDITDNFKTKIEAFKCHKSQKLTMLSLMWDIYLKAILNGLKNGVRFAETFTKIR